jgi:hypothetical protein
MELSTRFHDRRRECAEVAQLFGDDGLDHVQIQAGVFVHRHIAGADYSLHALSEASRKNASGLRQ